MTAPALHTSFLAGESLEEYTAVELTSNTRESILSTAFTTRALAGREYNASVHVEENFESNFGGVIFNSRSNSSAKDGAIHRTVH